MGDSLPTGKASWYITHHQGQFNSRDPSRLGKSSTGLLGWGSSGARSPVSGDREHCDLIWQMMPHSRLYMDLTFSHYVITSECHTGDAIKIRVTVLKVMQANSRSHITQA